MYYFDFYEESLCLCMLQEVAAVCTEVLLLRHTYQEDSHLSVPQECLMWTNYDQIDSKWDKSGTL